MAALEDRRIEALVVMLEASPPEWGWDYF